MGGPPRTVEASVSPKARARLPLRRKLLYAAAAVVPVHRGAAKLWGDLGTVGD